MLNDTIQNFICKVGIIPIFIQKVLFLHNLIKIINIYVRKYTSISENRNECYRRGEGELRQKTNTNIWSMNKYWCRGLRA